MINTQLTCEYATHDVIRLNSIDSVSNEDDATMYPTEFLNSVDSSGLPPHSLTLAVNLPVMLIRNISSTDCNGSRYLITHIGARHLVCRSLSSDRTIYIPRIKLSPPPQTFPFEMIRFQFPLRPAFALTINKSQGQTLQSVGLLMTSQVFGHGQLYVALSRCREIEQLFIHDPTSLDDDPVLQNVVIPALVAPFQEDE